MIRIVATLALLLPFLSAPAQNVKAIRRDVRMLAGPSMHGRGYVDRGAEKAARYIVKQLQDAGLRPAADSGSYTQSYSFPVNSFPGPIALQINKKEPKAGVDYLVDARSTPFTAERMRLHHVNVAKVFRKGDSATRISRLSARGGAVYLQHPDTLLRSTFLRTIPGDSLPDGLYILPVKGKMTWTVRTDTFRKGATVVYVQDSALPRWPRRVTTQLVSRILRPDRNGQVNVAAKVPGTAVPDSFVVFTAHYDHLGELGRAAIFPGASDNASGTCTVLDLARYFAAHPQRYTVVFLFFSGEEAGLKGSDYYVKHPTLPLDHIRFLINLDMVGEAADGATVVNATKHTAEFELLQRLNAKGSHLPKLNSRGEAANSDHYHFTEQGVPCFFIYGNGGKGHYHDVFDTPADLSLEGTEGIERLLIDFVGKL
jgi:hypothetical protein